MTFRYKFPKLISKYNLLQNVKPFDKTKFGKKSYLGLKKVFLKRLSEDSFEDL